MQTPNFHAVLEARRRIRPYLARTPMYSYPAINDLIGTSVYIKDDWTPVRIGA
jgi:threonine dehydratase